MAERIRTRYVVTTYWAHPLLKAVGANPRLAEKHPQWARSHLSDLAFSIETRLGALADVVRLIDENLDELGGELERETNAAAYVGQAYQFQNDRALRWVLIGASSLIAEWRACFENPADFYREFLQHYLARRSRRGRAVSELRRALRALSGLMTFAVSAMTPSRLPAQLRRLSRS